MYVTGLRREYTILQLLIKVRSLLGPLCPVRAGIDPLPDCGRPLHARRLRAPVVGHGDPVFSLALRSPMMLRTA